MAAPLVRGLADRPHQRPRPQHPLDGHAESEACDDVAGPVREQRHARQRQGRRDGAHEAALQRRQQAGGGCQRAHVHGMAGREGVAWLPGEGNAAAMPSHRQPVRPDLVEGGFQDMRQHRRCQRNGQEMIACAALCVRSKPGVEPARRGEGQQQMLIRAPGQRLGRVLELRVGVIRDLVRDRDVDPGGFDCYERHRSTGSKTIFMTVL